MVQTSIYLSSLKPITSQLNTMIRFIFILTMAGAMFSCKNEKATKEQSAEQPNANTQTAPAQEATLSSVPLELIQRIWEEGTQVDYIYHYHPFTISLSERAAIQNTMRHIAESPAPITPGCQPAGIVTFQIDGDIVLRGDFYFDTNCTFFVFYDKDKNKYSNYMTQEGITYFNNQIQQGLNLRNQAQQ